MIDAAFFIVHQWFDAGALTHAEMQNVWLIRYCTYASITHEHIFDYKRGDVYACVADAGWITGHTCVLDSQCHCMRACARFLHIRTCYVNMSLFTPCSDSVRIRNSHQWWQQITNLCLMPTCIPIGMWYTDRCLTARRRLYLSRRRFTLMLVGTGRWWSGSRSTSSTQHRRRFACWSSRGPILWKSEYSILTT